MPTKKELLANEKNIDEMCEYINAKSLKFLSLKVFILVLKKENETNLTLNLVIIILLVIILLKYLII